MGVCGAARVYTPGDNHGDKGSSGNFARRSEAARRVIICGRVVKSGGFFSFRLSPRSPSLPLYLSLSLFRPPARNGIALTPGPFEGRRRSAGDRRYGASGRINSTPGRIARGPLLCARTAKAILFGPVELRLSNVAASPFSSAAVRSRCTTRLLALEFALDAKIVSFSFFAFLGEKISGRWPDRYYTTDTTG